MWGASPRSIGRPEFRLWVDRLYDRLLGTRESKEDISFRKPTSRLTPDDVLNVVCRELNIRTEDVRRCRRDSTARAIAAKMLCGYAGSTQRQAAAALGLCTGAAVSAQLKKLNDMLANDRSLRRLVSRIAKRLTTSGQDRR